MQALGYEKRKEAGHSTGIRVRKGKARGIRKQTHAPIVGGEVRPAHRPGSWGVEGGVHGKGREPEGKMPGRKEAWNGSGNLALGNDSLIRPIQPQCRRGGGELLKGTGGMPRTPDAYGATTTHCPACESSLDRGRSQQTAHPAGKDPGPGGDRREERRVGARAQLPVRE